MIGLIRIAVASLLAVVSSIASAAIIYFADVQGHVGRYDDVTTVIAPVGNASATFTIGQVIGIAWDPTGNRILLLDRNAPAVYAMNPVSGATSLLFNPGISFQGGAVVGSTLYGIDEGTQTVKAFNLTTFANQGLSAPILSNHTHGMGVNPANGQLYGGVGNASTVFTVSALGAEGPIVVTASPSNFYDDIDYYGGDFLGTDFSNNVIARINGVTGATTQFLSAAQLSSGGLTTNVAGVVVAGAAAPPPPPSQSPVPTLSEWGLILLAVIVAASAIPLLRRFGA
jgi:hypothetical protein